jgi:hypothetical protein
MITQTAWAAARARHLQSAVLFFQLQTNKRYCTASRTRMQRHAPRANLRNVLKVTAVGEQVAHSPVELKALQVQARMRNCSQAHAGCITS